MDKVIKGKQGYLFLAGNQNAVIEQHTGKRILGEEKLARWNYLLRKRWRRLRQRRCKYFILVVPDKHYIYSQYLPDGTMLAPHRNIDRLIQTLSRKICRHFSYPGEELRLASANEQVYYRKDTHWTDKGAYIAYRLLMELVSKDFPDTVIVQNPEYRLRPHQGDLARMIDLDHEESYEIYVPDNELRPGFDNRIIGTGQVQVFHNNDVKNRQVAMIFGSSSTTMLMKFLKGSFNTVIFCWSPNFDYGLIDHFSPSLVISQIRERHLIRPADDEQGLTTTEIAFIKSFPDSPGRELVPFDCNHVNLLLACLAKAGNPVNRRNYAGIERIAWKLGLAPILQQSVNMQDAQQPWRRIRQYVEKTFSEFCKEISTSELYDPFYIESALASYTPVLQDNDRAGLYLLFGQYFDYQSGPGFNGGRYWEKYPDVQQAGLHPLIHYLRHGRYETRTLPP